MSEKVVKLGILKLGCVGSAPLLEFLLDERAERNDIETRVIGSGANMGKKLCEEVANCLLSYNPDFAIVVSPNATIPGPTVARQTLLEKGIPTIIISDSPVKKIRKDLEASGFGYIIPEADSMIGARREFLDPLEMALFNADVIKVLAITGVFNLIVESIDFMIQAIKNGESPVLPRVVVTKAKAIAASGLQNPYAKAKAMAAYEISNQVAGLTREGCFVIQEWERYTEVVAAAHEMMRVAARLSDEAREIEKSEDNVFRKPHAKDGVKLSKMKLIEKPVRSP